jgi:hypothetical protein
VPGLLPVTKLQYNKKGAADARSLFYCIAPMSFEPARPTCKSHQTQATKKTAYEAAVFFAVLVLKNLDFLNSILLKLAKANG